jgi:RNA polymerase sigma-70 factor (ECF subfamily)
MGVTSREAAAPPGIRRGQVSGQTKPSSAIPTVEELFRDHVSDVFHMVRRILGPGANDADVEDVTQQVFVAAHRGLTQFRGESKPTTWLYTIAYRVALATHESWRKSRKLRKALEDEAALASEATSPEEEIAHRRELTRVWRCLMRIKPKKRAVYILYEIEGREGTEIAELLGVSLNTVWSRLFHARKELFEALERSERETMP